MTDCPNRRLFAVLLLAGVPWVHAKTALACLTMPPSLTRPHAIVVAEAKRIFWAEVVSAQPMKRGEKAWQAVRYKLKVLRLLKGQAGAMIEIEADKNLNAISDTTFADHTQDEFWKQLSGRMEIESDCTMLPPHFIVGKRYLILLAASKDTKQFERVDTEDDRWLKYVESQITRAP